MNTIQLLEPHDGSTTDPRQAHPWPGEASSHRVEQASSVPILWESLEVVTDDRSRPRPVVFSWVPVPSETTAIRYDLALSRTTDLSNASHVRDLAKARTEMSHLFLGTPYYWQVTARVGSEIVAQSPVFHFVTHPKPPRWIHVPGMTNVRDMGGWPLADGRTVRQGIVYRSSEMNDHLEVTEDGARLLVHDLGIRTDLDLRRPYEGKGPALDPQRVEWINVPILPYGGLNVDELMGRDGYRRIFQTLADPSRLPVIVHCLGGADRAGTVAFLLGAVLGMSMDDLCTDYELTSLSIWGPRHRSSDEFTSLLQALKPFSRDPENVHEQAENYLLDIGVTHEELTSLRQHMIVPAG